MDLGEQEEATVPVNLSYSGGIDWRLSVTEDLRNHIVHKLVLAICPTLDINHLQDECLASLIQYARSKEETLFGLATTQSEYYQFIAEKIYKIQKELEKKRQKRKELKAIKLQESKPMQMDLGEQEEATVPANLSSSSGIDWRLSITEDLRNHIVHKLVIAIWPTLDVNHLQDERLASLLQYARSKEETLFGLATTQSEYYQLVAENIHKIQRGLEEKRQKRKELKPIKLQESESLEMALGEQNEGHVTPFAAPTGNDWRLSVSEDFRNDLVHKLVLAILFPSPNPDNPDINTMQDERMIILLEHARQLEETFFETANTRSEYYHLLAEKVYKIQKEKEEKRHEKQIQDQMKAMKLTSTTADGQGSSAGQVGPSTDSAQATAPASNLPSSGPHSETHQ